MSARVKEKYKQLPVKQKKTKVHYRYSVPLKTGGQGFIYTTQEEVHVFWKLQALAQASSNSGSLTLSPVSQTSSHG